MKSKPTYWQRLCAHPGPPYAIMFTIMGILAGLPNHPFLGALAMSWTWVMVLWTARTQPVE